MILKQSLIYLGKTGLLFVLGLTILNGCTSDPQQQSPIAPDRARVRNEAQLNFLNQSIEEDPSNDELYFKRARIYHDQNDLLRARQDIDKAIKLNPSLASYHVLSARIYLLGNKGKEALAAAQRAETLQNADLELLTVLAQTYLDQRDTSKAMAYFNRAQALMPEHSDIYYISGLLSETRKDTLKAIAAFKKAIALDIHHVKAYRELVYVYDRKGWYDSSLVYLLKAREQCMPDALFYYHEGNVFAVKGLTESARFAYESALRLDSAFYKASYMLGKLHQGQSRWEDAYKYYTHAAQYEPNRLDLWLALVDIVSIRQNKPLATIPYFEQLVRLDSNTTYYRYQLDKLKRQQAYESRPDSLRVRYIPDTQRRAIPVQPIADTTR